MEAPQFGKRVCHCTGSFMNSDVYTIFTCVL